MQDSRSNMRLVFNFPRKFVNNETGYILGKPVNYISKSDAGDIMEYRGSKYIIISQIDANEKTYKARIRKCSYRIAFNWSGNIKWFDCLEESKVFDITTGTYISYASEL